MCYHQDSCYINSFHSFLVQSLECNKKDEVPKDTSDVDGNALLVATDCDEGITMCMNMTVMDSEKMRTGRRQFQLPDPRH